MLITSICLVLGPGQVLHVFKKIGFLEPGFDWVDLIWRIPLKTSIQLDDKEKKREIYPHEEAVTFSWNVRS